jgi:hypothetical protein
LAAHQNQPLDPCKGQSVTAQQFRPWSAEVWRLDRWMRERPMATTIATYRERLACAAGTGHRAAIRRRWGRDRAAFYRHRRSILAQNINHVWASAVYPEAAWFSLAELKPEVAAALAEKAGEVTGTEMPGWTMVQVSKGEGDLKPGSRSIDDGFGWLAITAPFGDNLGVPQLGGYWQMLNPVKCADVAARMWGSQPNHFGPGGTWHGSAFVTDPDKHYRGQLDLRRWLGGLTFAQALKAE